MDFFVFFTIFDLYVLNTNPSGDLRMLLLIKQVAQT